MFKSNHQGGHTSQSGLILNQGLFQKQDALREERKTFLKDFIGKGERDFIGEQCALPEFFSKSSSYPFNLS